MSLRKITLARGVGSPTNPGFSSGLMAGAEGRLAPFAATILAPGYDGGPAGGPGDRGFHKPRGCPSWIAEWFVLVRGLRERVDTMPRSCDRIGPLPGRLDFQAAPAPPRTRRAAACSTW